MEKRLERMEMIEKPKEKSELRLNLTTNQRSGDHVLTITDIELSIGDKKLLEKSSMNI